jgi:hypothetical protein
LSSSSQNNLCRIMFYAAVMTRQVLGLVFLPVFFFKKIISPYLVLQCLRSSPIAEVLTSSAWTLLLERVGDEFMNYLLKYSSMFLPLPRQQHQQVTGPPITDFVFQSSRRKGHSPNLVGNLTAHVLILSS